MKWNLYLGEWVILPEGAIVSDDELRRAALQYHCVAVPLVPSLTGQVHLLLEEIAIISPRTIGEVTRGFTRWVADKGAAYGTSVIAADVEQWARCCLVLARDGASMPWESDYSGGGIQ